MMDNKFLVNLIKSALDDGEIESLDTRSWMGVVKSYDSIDLTIVLPLGWLDKFKDEEENNG